MQPSCCAHKPDSVPDQQTPTEITQADTPEPTKGGRTGPGWNALKCRGLSTLWVTSGAVLPPAPPLTWAPLFRPVGWVLPLDLLALALADRPLTPPPRHPLG